ncbi:MAG: hypothetical protein IPP84_14085 [Propionivibrio sp.]|uniref:hypothetical protein n=1 Tax=Propionivibrio sp. TaxID=2212460 RepID=UPI0025EB6249|nr:hypothetical protein [Propionivibrio sp.]MBL0209025.1 hypothetical protein [Propionivibrio sp.]
MISLKRWPLFALLFLLALAWVIYYPGLSGVFLLDDYQNLKTLERIESPATLQSLASAVLSNPSGDSGRSLAMLSFAAQHGSWPNDPRAFKQVNLLIHLVNAALLFLLALQLGTFRRLTLTQSAITALFVSAIWVVHPMHVSTVLYVIKRMTMLACLFILIGLIGYLLGRRCVLRKPWQGYLMMTNSLVIAGGLALLCKEIAILLPLYVLIFDTTLLRDTPHPPFYRQWQCIVIWLPIAIIFSYFALEYSSWILPGYDFRNFTPVERLFTESRVVVNYLGLQLLPRAGEFGLFHDDYVLSHGLVTPTTTLLSLMALLILLVTAVIQRKRYPAYSFAVFMFLEWTSA